METDDVKERARAAAQAMPQWPLMVVLVVVGVGLGLAGAGVWRAGAIVIGAGVGVAALLRVAVPFRMAGLLQVRGKAFDVTVLVVAAVGIVALALSR